MIEKVLLSFALLSNVGSEPIVNEQPTQQGEIDNSVEDLLNEWLKDEDGDGKPDKLSEEIEKLKNKELIGGITLGAVASALFSSLMFFISINSYRKRYKRILESSDNVTKVSTENLTNWKKEIDKVVNDNNEKTDIFIHKFQDLNNKFENLNIALNHTVEVVNKNNGYLCSINNVDKKLDVILDNEVSIACNNDLMVRSGVAKKIKQNSDNLKGKN